MSEAAPDRRNEAGPFDIIGDVHGCRDELLELLSKLGYRVRSKGGHAGDIAAVAPAGRRLVFLGDYIDRGPYPADVLRLVMSLAKSGQALAIPGNHDGRLVRWLDGRNVQLTHGLAETVHQLQIEPEAFRRGVRSFLDDLPIHLWLDGGRLAVAHAGIREHMLGRISASARAFCLYGDTTGETDELGFPVRRNWAAKYRGETTIVYGHTPLLEAEWLNNTICIDTGCCFGGKLTALRWPEREIVSVPTARAYATPARPLARMSTR
jgi:protein phosphatase